MTESAILFDVGGVILTNAWDRTARRQVVQQFGLDLDEFESRHEQVVAPFECGRLTIEEYLDRTVFYASRPFARDAFREAMYSQSWADPDSLALLADLRRSGRFLLATLNNESRELNQFRIAHFGLRDYFTAFLSSCYLGLRKPDPDIYRRALEIMQRRPDECVFVDDRPENVAAAVSVGIRAIHFHGAQSLRSVLVL